METILTKQKFTAPQVSALTAEIADKAEQLLGYTALKHGVALGELASALCALDIEYFPVEQVEAYKREMRRATEVRLTSERLQRIKAFNKKYGWWARSFSAPSGMWEDKREAEQIHNADWRLSPLGGGQPQQQAVNWGALSQMNAFMSGLSALAASVPYSEPIPIHVLNKAIQIKEHVPAAYFSVDALMVSRFSADPFLWVSLGGERYCIEVWDEPKFEAEM